MGHLDRRIRRTGRYGSKHGGSNEPLYPPVQRPAPPSPARDAPPVAPGLPPPAPDLCDLLGRSVLEHATQRLLGEHGLTPAGGPGAGLSRSYLARSAGAEIAADAHGLITTVFLHVAGEDGFTPWSGPVPFAGEVTGRSGLWAALGRPDRSTDPYRDRFLGEYGPADRWRLTACVLHAQYGTDGESLCRVTLKLPG